MSRDQGPILILGAGINGGALAREFALNGLSVCVVDKADVASGATSYSSRLVHGGLRYLEHGEFGLVRESLAERTRLLNLAPHLVRVLPLSIPVADRFGGLINTVRRFLGRDDRPSHQAGARGLLWIRLGLWMYELFGRDPRIPRSFVHSADGAGGFPRNPAYRWWCTYSDAQVRYPERMTVALLEDARRASADQGLPFAVFTHCRAVVRDGSAVVEAMQPDRSAGLEEQGGFKLGVPFRPAAVVNAAGAWVDQALGDLQVSSAPLMGGTKGSHFLTRNPRLHAWAAQRGFYAEAPDGRPVFILPFGPYTLVGTTDVPFVGDPRAAMADAGELEYLVRTVNAVLPDAQLTADDVEFHYSGVRPLPASSKDTPASITRRHWVREHEQTEPPVFSIIGGKLTTCRSLAEQSVRKVLHRLNLPFQPTTRDRPLPGGSPFPVDLVALSRTVGVTELQAAAVVELCGTQAEEFLHGLSAADRTSVPGLDAPVGFARRVVQREWAVRLEDLAERRLMALFQPGFSVAGLRRLAELLVEEGRLPADRVEAETTAVREIWRRKYGRRLVEPAGEGG